MTKPSRGLRNLLVYFFAAGAIGAAGWGVRAALRSPLFLVQVVEITEKAEADPEATVSPVDPQTLTDLAAIPVGEVNLIDLDLKSVEARLLSNPWVREVSIQKRFPQTVSIAVAYKKPRAILQSQAGSLSYVDEEGAVFGALNLLVQPDLPLFTGFGQESLSRTQRIQDALQIVRLWPASSELSGLSWDDERGFRALASYAPRGASAVRRTIKTMVDLGVEPNVSGLTSHFKRLSEVFDYLRDNSISVRQIWADSGKKIVVKTTHGS